MVTNIPQILRELADKFEQGTVALMGFKITLNDNSTIIRDDFGNTEIKHKPADQILTIAYREVDSGPK